MNQAEYQLYRIAVQDIYGHDCMGRGSTLAKHQRPCQPTNLITLELCWNSSSMKIQWQAWVIYEVGGIRKQKSKKGVMRPDKASGDPGIGTICCIPPILNQEKFRCEEF